MPSCTVPPNSGPSSRDRARDRRGDVRTTACLSPGVRSARFLRWTRSEQRLTIHRRRSLARSRSPWTNFDRAFLDFARKWAVPSYPLARELLNEDYRRLRLGPCCHSNAEGHRVLVRVFEPIVLELLGASREPS